MLCINTLDYVGAQITRTQIACTQDITSDGEKQAFRNMRAVTCMHNLDLYTLLPKLF